MRKVDLNRKYHLLREFWCSGVQRSQWTATRIAGLFPVVAVLAIIVLAYIAAVPFSMVPLARKHPIFGTIVLLVFHFVYVMTVVHYLLLVYMDPGGVPRDWKVELSDEFGDGNLHSVSDSDETVDESDGSDMVPFVRRKDPTAKAIPRKVGSFNYLHLMHERTSDGNVRYCHQCKVFKPDRCHHCSSCGRCILRFDHHCVFINNCVSHYTYKFFLAFIVYAFIGCLMVSVFGFSTFADVTIGSALPKAVETKSDHIAGKRPAVESGTAEVPVSLTAVFLIGYILSSAFCFALGIFIVFHGYLLVRGRTTVEFYEIKNPVCAARVARYDLGSYRNVRSACGTNALFWLLPTRAFVEGNGLTFERRPEEHNEVV